MLNLASDAVRPSQLAEQTGFSESTLASWRCRGKGPKFIRVHGRIYYRNEDVQEWLEEQIEAA